MNKKVKYAIIHIVFGNYCIIIILCTEDTEIEYAYTFSNHFHFYCNIFYSRRLKIPSYALSHSQRELSRLSDVSQKTISRIENGLDMPDIGTLEKLAKPLGFKIKIELVELDS
ncbi:helix-turn-helix transcriptional regulator [Bacillus cereus]|uniref:helix-turn-helix domain-containing protein n=1 Tax=Bacillus pseudomycoides TaxID=64104 RepID=UPI00355EF8F8